MRVITARLGKAGKSPFERLSGKQKLALMSRTYLISDKRRIGYTVHVPRVASNGVHWDSNSDLLLKSIALINNAVNSAMTIKPTDIPVLTPLCGTGTQLNTNFSLILYTVSCTTCSSRTLSLLNSYYPGFMTFVKLIEQDMETTAQFWDNMFSEKVFTLHKSVAARLIDEDFINPLV